MTQAHGPLEASFDASYVLAHTDWVRALARGLLRSDPALADDLAQEVCLAALYRPRLAGGSLAGWLAGALRNLVRQHRRGEGRRRAREAAVARAERQPSAFELVERLALHRQVVEAVAGLDEPYRTVVLERFFEGRSVRAIARAQGVALATVKTRLARALVRLRSALDREHGEDGRAWAFALLPLARGAASGGTSLWGILVMSTQVKLALAAAVVCAGALWFCSGERARPTAPLASLHAARVDEEDSSAAPEVPTANAQRMTVAAEPEVVRPGALEVAPTPPASAAIVQGRVLDCSGSHVAGVRVWFEPGRGLSSSELVLPASVPPADTPSIACDARGRFEFDSPRRAGRFLAFEPRYATVLAGLWRPGAQSMEVVLVVAPRLSYSGRVVAEDGRPLAGARVVLLLPRELRARIAEVLDGSAECGWLARSDEQGAFALPGVPLVKGARLKASLEGWIGEFAEAPPSSSRGIELVLRQPAVDASTLCGQVFDPAGWPVEEALVWLGSRTASTDRQGLFCLAVPAEGTSAPLIAVKRGHLPAIETPSSGVQSGHPEGEFVHLCLGSAPLAIEGRVVDESGAGLAGIHVWVGDPTLFGALDEIPAHVEGILAGAKTRSELEALLAGLVEAADPEAALFHTSTVMWSFEKTDADGRFRLTGLLAREYQLSAMDPSTLQRADAGSFRAGAEGVEIRLPRVEERPLKGRVLSASGVPVRGVSVVPRCDVITAHLDEHSWSTVHGQVPAAFTDADGRFELARVPERGVYLVVEGEAILPQEVGRDEPRGLRALARDGELVVQVELQRHLQVEFGASELGRVDELHVLDEAGERLRIRVIQGTARFEADAYSMREGRSDVLIVSERGRTLVLTKLGAEVRRVPLALTDEVLNLVRP
ncbi:MAG: sigma-70 family RNA polymerase sigma factor [Planctomycetes bacterium]|nr:sigma-70 family RNA polymerase sigma factor [Planctomycetota bacterium]